MHDGLIIMPIITKFFVHDKLGLFWIWNRSTVDNGGVEKGQTDTQTHIRTWRLLERIGLRADSLKNRNFIFDYVLLKAVHI